MKPLHRLALALAVGALLASCSSKAAVAPDGTPLSPNPVLPSVTLKIGPASIAAEVADSAAEREKGLMFRKSLPEGTGMLFVFELDQPLAFWMKNTTIPLSIAYISSDGTIRDILPLEPLSLAPVNSSRSVRYALEVPRGWFERAGVKVGDRMELPRLP